MSVLPIPPVLEIIAECVGNWLAHNISWKHRTKAYVPKHNAASIVSHVNGADGAGRQIYYILHKMNHILLMMQQ